MTGQSKVPQSIQIDTNTEASYSRKRRIRGVAVLWLVMTLIVLLLFMGFTIDGGRVYFAAHQLQNAADAAALAGARIVRIDQTQARDQAQYIGGKNSTLGDSVVLDLNTGNDPNGDIVVGRFYYDERGFIPMQDLPPDVCGPDSLKVVAKRTVTDHNNAIPLFFGALVNVKTANVSRVAIAQAIGGWGAGIITLNCYEEKSLDIGDAATDVVLVAGGIQVNSSAEDAFYGNTNTVYDPIPENINVNGGVRKIPSSLYDVTNTGAPRMPDPLCPDAQCDGTILGSDCIAEPTIGSPVQTQTVSVGPNEVKTIGPGYYPGGIDLRNSTGTLILERGIYILDGEGLYINGGNLLARDGVMFFVTNNVDSDARVYIGGNGLVEINTNSEIESGPYTGIAIFQDRDNDNDATIIGTGNINIVGTLYFPGNHVKISGTGDGFGTQLIADTLEIGGTGLIQINYDGRNPFPANKAILVY